jgi:hypothetical protein
MPASARIGFVRLLEMLLLALMVITSCAGLSLSAGGSLKLWPLTSDGSPSSEAAKRFREDNWVESQVVASNSSFCSGVAKCGRNASTGSFSIYDDTISDKKAILFGDASCDDSEHMANVDGASLTSEAIPKVAAGSPDSRVSQLLTLETVAVELSLLVQHSCMEVGYHRRCWHARKQDPSAEPADRKLRPITITFYEPTHASQGVFGLQSPELPRDFASPLVTSLKNFRLPA